MMNSMIRPSFHAVILAGGRGTRLGPYTTVLPKPLMPVGGHPILGIIIQQLQRAGATRVTLAVNHMADLIRAVVGDGSRYGLQVEYSLEESALGTIAPLKLIPGLPDKFLVMNGDILTKLDPSDLLEAHNRSGCRLTIASFQRDTRIDFGVLDVDPVRGRLLGHTEKPTYHFNVSMGMYAMDRSLLDSVPDGQHFGVDTLALGMLSRDEPVNIFQYEGYWLDLGRPSDFEKANQDILDLGLVEPDEDFA
jgi:NDP-sugar pyrophosphorylase family protein